MQAELKDETLHIKQTNARDIPDLKLILNETELFPSDMLEDMIEGFLADGLKEDLWLTCETNGAAVGFCYVRAEKLAEGTWNMLAIAVLPDIQGKGAGSALTNAVEQILRAQGERILIVDTSGTTEFALARRFYAKNGYSEEARIRDFWAKGDDKVIFRKAL